MRISDWSSDVCSSDLRESPRYTQSLRNCSPRCCRRSRQLISSTKRLTCWTLAGKEFREGPAHLWFMMRFGSTTLRKPRKLTKFLPRFDESRPNGTHKTWSYKTLTDAPKRSEEHTSELQSLMRISNAVFCF